MKKSLLSVCLLTFLLCPAFTRAADISTGEVTKVDAEKNTLLVATDCSCGSGKTIESSFTVKTTTKILLNGKEAKLADLKSGDDAEVEFNSAEDVTKVSVTRYIAK